MAPTPDATDQYIRQLRAEEAMRLLETSNKIFDDLGIWHEFRIDMAAIYGQKEEDTNGNN
jgi:hypothetical protein